MHGFQLFCAETAGDDSIVTTGIDLGNLVNCQYLYVCANSFVFRMIV